MAAALLLHVAAFDIIDDGALRAYLAAVYPAAAKSIAARPTADLVAFYESLHYYYDCAPGRLGRLKPAAACASLNGTAPPRLPYVAPGRYFAARNARSAEKVPGTAVARRPRGRGRGLERSRVTLAMWIVRGRVAAAPRPPAGYSVERSRRRYRGCHVDYPWASRGGAAAAGWIFRRALAAPPVRGRGGVRRRAARSFGGASWAKT